MKASNDVSQNRFICLWQIIQLFPIIVVGAIIAGGNAQSTELTPSPVNTPILAREPAIIVGMPQPTPDRNPAFRILILCIAKKQRVM